MHGIYTQISGNIYVGDFFEDKYQGKGIMNYATGGRYEGDFSDDKMHRCFCKMAIFTPEKW